MRAEYAGVQVSVFDPESPGNRVFAEGSCPYSFRFLSLHRGQRHRVGGLLSSTAYVTSGSCLVAGATASRGCSIRVEDQEMSLEAVEEGTTLVIAGTRQAQAQGTGVVVTRAEDIKQVQKPWGRELWIRGDRPGYALKEILIKEGFRTSLQYHRLKRETNVLVSGRCRLHYDGGQVELGPVSSMDVPPGTLHRIEALTDIVLYEASTPELDDVVRVSDDAGRPDGRIPREHGS